MPEPCICKLDELECRKALDETAKIIDSEQRARTILMIQSMHEAIEKVILPNHACSQCPYRKQ